MIMRQRESYNGDINRSVRLRSRCTNDDITRQAIAARSPSAWVVFYGIMVRLDEDAGTHAGLRPARHAPLLAMVEIAIVSVRGGREPLGSPPRRSNSGGQPSVSGPAIMLISSTRSSQASGVTSCTTHADGATMAVSQ